MLSEITVAELGEKLRSEEKFILLDVREQDEFNHARITDARVNIAPMSKLARQGITALPEAVRAGDVPVYVICHHGVRSVQVTTWLIQQGFMHVVNVTGGIDEYARRVDSSVGLY
jgi:rhodanese-related sulfurtransferase